MVGVLCIPGCRSEGSGDARCRNGGDGGEGVVMAGGEVELELGRGGQRQEAAVVVMPRVAHGGLGLGRDRPWEN